jgi:hypothetical protein
MKMVHILIKIILLAVTFIIERVVFVTSGSSAHDASGDVVSGIVRLDTAVQALSVATNGTSTALIAYKAWQVYCAELTLYTNLLLAQAISGPFWHYQTLTTYSS